MRLRNKLLALLVGIGCIASTIGIANFNNNYMSTFAENTLYKRVFIYSSSSSSYNYKINLTYYEKEGATGESIYTKDKDTLGEYKSILLPVATNGYCVFEIYNSAGTTMMLRQTMHANDDNNCVYTFYFMGDYTFSWHWYFPSADYYAEYFNSLLGYETGVCDYSGNTNTEKLSNAWISQKAVYESSITIPKIGLVQSISDTEKNNLASATSTSSGELGKFAALYDFIYAKYVSTLGLTNFANRTVSVSSSNGSSSSYLYRGASATDSNNYVILIIVSASTLLLLSAGTVLLIKKKKRIK